jgi:LysR family positive regulator for ilvC
MDVEKLRIFVDLAVSLHFGRTAEMHHMSASTLSRMLQRLEKQAGASLIYRDNRNARLTRAGEQYLIFARETLLRWQRFQNETAPEIGALRGAVSLYCSVTASHSVLAGLLGTLRQQQPDIEIKLNTGDQAFSTRRVLDHNADFAIAARPDKLDAKLAFTSLAESELVFIMPRADCVVSDQIKAMRAQGEIIWNNLPWVVAERGLARDRLDNWFAHRGIQPEIYAQVSGHEAIVSMVGLGCGIGMVPKLVITNSPAFDSIEIIDRQFIVPTNPLVSFDIGWCVLKRRLDEPLIQAVWSCVNQE